MADLMTSAARYQAHDNEQHSYSYQNTNSTIEQQHLQEQLQTNFNQHQNIHSTHYIQNPNELNQDAHNTTAGIVEQYTAGTAQLAQQQGPNGYKINVDPNPQIIRKHANDAVTYKQEVAVRYLRPPTPPPPGPLIIKEIRKPALPAAPPIVIRQRPPRPATPPPLIIRERPPQPPAQLAPKLVTKPLPAPPPPPRRVIIERMPPLPPKPQSIIVERWLPYKQQKRRVVYQKAPPIQPPAPQKNLIIQWEGTQARVVKEFRNLGIIKADPSSYVQQYGEQLRPTQGLPDFIKGLPTPTLGPEYNPINPDHIDPALLAGAAGPLGNYENIGEQGRFTHASNNPLLGTDQTHLIQDNLQHGSFDGPNDQLTHEQPHPYAYQSTTYPDGNLIDEQQQQYSNEQYQQNFEQQIQHDQGLVHHGRYQSATPIDATA